MPCAGSSDLGDIILSNAAVNCKECRRAVIVQHLPYCTYPVICAFHKALLAESGIDAHYKDKICCILPAERLQYFDIGIGVYSYTCLKSQRPYLLYKSLRFLGALDMECDHIGTCLCKRLYKIFGVSDHKVGIEGHACHLPYGLYYGNTDREIGNIVTVHYIYMDRLALALDLLKVSFKISKISRQY